MTINIFMIVYVRKYQTHLIDIIYGYIIDHSWDIIDSDLILQVFVEMMNQFWPG